MAAPYRHFADRDELLAAVAVRALHAFGQALAAQLAETDPPERRLAAMAGGYVRFAAEQRALFSVVFGIGLDKKRHYPELRQAYEQLENILGTCVGNICPGGPDSGGAACRRRSRPPLMALRRYSPTSWDHPGPDRSQPCRQAGGDRDARVDSWPGGAVTENQSESVSARHTVPQVRRAFGPRSELWIRRQDLQLHTSTPAGSS